MWISIVWRLLLLMLTPALGAFVSLQNNDWTWFARYGSILVAQSVAIFGLAYCNDGKNVLSDMVEQMTPPEQLSEELQKGLFEGKLSRLRQAFIWYVVAAGGAVIGTLIWGFGDLVSML